MLQYQYPEDENKDIGVGFSRDADAASGRGGAGRDLIRDMDGAPRNPAPRNHFLRGLSNHQLPLCRWELDKQSFPQAKEAAQRADSHPGPVGAPPGCGRSGMRRQPRRRSWRRSCTWHWVALRVSRYLSNTALICFMCCSSCQGPPYFATAFATFEEHLR